MRRLFGAHVYSDAPRAGCFWDRTGSLPEVDPLKENLSVDVAIIGGGYAGLNAALALAKGGANVAVLDANAPGWGASTRNGGFCCLGGGAASDATLDRRFGRLARLEWRQAEIAAVAYVADLLAEYKVDADVHSSGETVLAHRPTDARRLEEEALQISDNYGVDADLHSIDDLARAGLSAGFHGGLTIPIGFALNPRAYFNGLLMAAQSAGANVYSNATVTVLAREGGRWVLKTPQNTVYADTVLVASNGYSSENVPPWLAGRYMPVQSSVGVTRVLTEDEIAQQGWWSHQMCYDTRRLLHYFHLLPDRRMLFGMRGGLGGTAASDRRAYARLRQDFDTCFPAWTDVPFTHMWTGMACLARNRMPFVGVVPDTKGLWCALGFHGNGVAMGSYAGKMIAQAILSGDASQVPEVVCAPLAKFPLGTLRRALMRPVYASFMLADM